MDKNLIQYCPHCGKKREDEFSSALENGGVWLCRNCRHEVEAYVLNDEEEIFLPPKFYYDYK